MSLQCDAELESYRMFVTNYLVALIGNRKNDKISLNINHKEELEQFRKENEKDIKQLETIRDQVYSHFDLDYYKNCDKISMQFIEKCIYFVAEVLGILDKILFV